MSADSSFDSSPGLTVVNSLDDLVRSYERTREHIELGFASFNAARAEFNSTFALGNGSRSTLSIHANSRCHDEVDSSPAHTIEMLDRQFWAAIVDRLELRLVMSTQRWAELQEQIKNGKLPPITHANVLEFGRANVNMRSLEQMMRESIAEVFEWLRPRKHWARTYKTNSELEIGERVILSGVVEASWLKTYKVRSWSHGNDGQRMICMERVFHWLDGRGQVADAHQSDLQQAIEKRSIEDGYGETELFKFRACKNRSLHLTFKRLDLLKRFNEIAGGARLRPTKAGESDLAVA